MFAVRNLVAASATRQICARQFTKMSGLEDVVVLSAVRTPIGSFRGVLSPLSAQQLGGVAIKGAVEKAGVDPKAVQEVGLGHVVTAGTGQDPTKQAALLAGLEKSTITWSVAKLCAAGMKSVCFASQTIMTGYDELIVAGGMESMSNGVLFIRRGDTPYGGVKLEDLTLDTLTDVYEKLHMGACADKTAAMMKITREACDQYAIQSYKRVAAGYASGVFKNELVPVTVPSPKKGAPPKVVVEDEEYKKVIYEKVPTLKAAFSKTGVVTPANASKINDGAAALVLASAKAAKRLTNVKPLARIIGFCDVANEPVHFTLAPGLAVPKLLSQTGVKKDNVALWEVNEAFSSVPLITAQMADIDPAKVNIHGGAVAIGHPIGCSGARVTVHLIHSLKRGQIGVAGICNGAGGATAIMVERL